MVKHYRGSYHTEYFHKTASTAFAFNDMVTVLSTDAGTGVLKKAAAADTEIYGLIQRPIASTDDDYASTTLVPVLVGDTDTEFEFDVSTGTAATADIGQYIDIDDENSVDVDAFTLGVIKVTGILSTTKIIGKFTKKSGKATPITA